MLIICFAGIDASGKSTQIELLAEALAVREIPSYVSKAYGPREKAALEPFLATATPETILFMFQAFHAEQRQRALHALNDGRIVLADRWDESYLAFHSQYGALADKPALRKEMNRLAFKGVSPDITFLLNVPVKAAQERMRNRGEMSYFDKHPADYHERMKRAYLKLAKKASEKSPWMVIDSARPKEAVHLEILAHIARLFPEIFSKESDIVSRPSL